MGEYIVGHERIREPDGLLETGHVVETHIHKRHHNTDLTMGLWEVHRFQPIVGENTKQAVGNDGQPLWYAMPLMIVKGGGPRSLVPIPANMKHKFVLLEGPGFYRCRFLHYDMDGKVSEVWHGFDDDFR